MSNETLKCPMCKSYWECDIAEVELDEYEFVTGLKDCNDCVALAITMETVDKTFDLDCVRCGETYQQEADPKPNLCQDCWFDDYQKFTETADFPH